MSLLARAKKSASERLARNWAPAALPSRATAPLVSFSFDDFPRSAVTSGARILRSRGVRGSFYVAGGLEGSQHEGLDQFTREDLIALADLQRNQAFVQAVLGDYRLASFAYPFGHVDVWKKAEIGRHFSVSRGIWPGVNHGLVDFQQLKAIPLERRSFDHASAARALDKAQATNGWVIFFTHDVSDDSSPYGCTPDDLGRLLDETLARGIEVLPVKNAAAKVRFGQQPGPAH